MHLTLDKLWQFKFPGQKFNKLLQPVGELRTLRRVGSNLNSVSISIANLVVTIVEHWDGCAAQVAVRSSDIL